jgi:polar amino acid transport system substrate-binding protein
MRRTTLFLRTILIVAAALLALAACGDDDTTESGSTGEDTAGEATTDGGDGGGTDDAADTGGDGGGGDALEAPDGLVSGGTLTICSDTPYEPFEFRDESGEDTGYDIDLLRAVADRAGLDIEVIDLPFDGILGSLAAGDCDVVASALTITEERAEQVDFSEPYFDADQSLLVKSDAGVGSLDDLAGESIGVQSGTTGAQYARQNTPDGAEVVAFEDSDALFAAIEAGEIAAILQDLPVNAYRATQDDTLEVVETFATGEEYGFAVAKDNESVLSFVDDGLSALRDDGTFDEIYSTYFGEI